MGLSDNFGGEVCAEYYKSELGDFIIVNYVGGSYPVKSGIELG